MTTAIQVEVPIEDSTSISLTTNPERGRMLVYIGSCRLYGSLSSMVVVRAALNDGISDLEGKARAAVEQKTQEETAARCAVCHSMHAPYEPHATFRNNADREPAYNILRRTFLLSGKQPELIVDSVAMWLIAGDSAAARSLLALFVVDNVAHEIIDALRKSIG